MKIYILIILLHIYTSGFSQSIDNVIGNCETIEINDPVDPKSYVSFWLYSIDGNAWSVLDLSKEESARGLSLNFDETSPIYGSRIPDEPGDEGSYKDTYTGMLYIKREIYPSPVITDHNPNLPEFNYEYFVLQDKICAEKIKNTPYNQPVPCKMGYSTQILVYTVIPCSPALVEDPKSVELNCYYSKDGTTMLNFERGLAIGEAFANISLEKNIIDKNGTLTTISVGYIFEKLTLKQYALKELISGDYTFRYQTKIVINGKEHISTVVSTKFTVKIPSELKWKIKSTNPKCHGDKGEILIEATGGTPPYFYSLNDGTKTQFENSHTTDAAGLHKGIQTIIKPAGSYVIKVIDNKECIEK
jgi:hypothetical protein